jgi:putative transcriptional regulator
MKDKIVLRNRIKVFRAEHDITQQDLADAVRMSRQTIHAIEKGKFVPSVITAIKIADFFDTDLKNIFFIQRENNKE